jgi:hypothetical protein
MNRILAILVFITLAFIICIAYLKNFNFYHDDAFISLKYAQNLSNGNGLVWNINEYVQGYTNFLLVIILSLFSYLGIDLYLASRLVGICSYLALVIFSYFIFKPYKRLIDFIPFITISSSFPIIVWSLSGLETVLFSLLLFLSAILSLKCLKSNNINLSSLNGFLQALTFLLRPEGILIIIITSFFLLIKQSWKKLVFFSGSILLIVIPYLIWQLTYYGSIIPNSIIAKTLGVPKSYGLNGIFYLLNFIIEPPFIFIFVILISLFQIKKLKINFYSLYTISLIGSFLALICYVGGDHMPAYRFLVPLIPLIAILIHQLLPFIKVNKKYEYLIIIIFLISILSQPYFKKLNPTIPDYPVKLGSFIAEHIKGKWKPETLIAANPAGTIPFLANQYKYIDMLGLNDKVIAKRKISKITLEKQKMPGHTKGDGAYVLDRNPDIIIAGPVNGSDPRIDPWWLSDYEMAKDPRFEKNYVKKREFIEEREGLYIKFTYFERKDRI